MVIRSTLLTTFKNMIQHCNYRHWASQVALVVKNPPANPGDTRNPSLMPGSGGSPGGRHGNPLQYPCLENLTYRSLVGYSPWGSEELDTTEWLSSHAIIVRCCTSQNSSSYSWNYVCIDQHLPVSPTCPAPGNNHSNSPSSSAFLDSTRGWKHTVFVFLCLTS